MNWLPLTTIAQLEELTRESNQNPVIIFKHSYACSISKTALNRLERNWNQDQSVKTYFLDLLTYRDLSRAVAERFQVRHESPQVLLIEGEKAVYDRSHFDINFADIKKRLDVAAL